MQMSLTDNETWIVQVGGRTVERRANVGSHALSHWERLVYALWVADYGMRNAGDLHAARDLYETFQSDGVGMAEKLDLPKTREAFALTTEKLEEQYFRRFQSICEEIRSCQKTDLTGES